MTEPLKPITLTVTPVPAAKSRTMWLAGIITTLGGMVALIPEVIADPDVSKWINAQMSPRARLILGGIAALVGVYLRTLRKQTVAPIAGTPAATPPPPESNA